jgi:hypothetical protein
MIYIYINRKHYLKQVRKKTIKFVKKGDFLKLILNNFLFWFHKKIRKMYSKYFKI